MDTLTELRRDILELARKAEYNAGFQRDTKDRLLIMVIASRLKRAIKE